MRTIRHILDIKGYHVWSVAPDASVYEALKILADKNIGALLVIEDRKLVGILSERDYARKVILKGRSSLQTPVRDIMSSPVIFTTPQEDIDKCLYLMNSLHIRHLPVLDGEKVIGIVSIGDLVNAIISRQKELIQKLENYVLEHTHLT